MLYERCDSTMSMKTSSTSAPYRSTRLHKKIITEAEQVLLKPSEPVRQKRETIPRSEYVEREVKSSRASRYRRDNEATTQHQVLVTNNQANKRRRETLQKVKSKVQAAKSRDSCYRTGTSEATAHLALLKSNAANQRRGETMRRKNYAQLEGKNSHSPCTGTEKTAEHPECSIVVAVGRTNIQKYAEHKRRETYAAHLRRSTMQCEETTEHYFTPKVPVTARGPAYSAGSDSEDSLSGEDSDLGCSAIPDMEDSDLGCSAIPAMEDNYLVCSAIPDMEDIDPGYSARSFSENLTIPDYAPKGPSPEDCIVFMCANCNTPLGDFLKICSEDKRLDVLVCRRVSENLVWKEKLEYGSEGILRACLYRKCFCRSCGQCRGFILCSTPKFLAPLKNQFCLSKQGISCYCLKDGSTVPASTVNFYMPPFGTHLDDVKIQLVVLHQRIASLEEQLHEALVNRHLPL
ncbi:protein Mis18-beta isoform X2 [Protopterus annectens]|uniref:protein Mis18-beta isoform X2 n=1 Tax=Protopterus annectens TaxID=7888 RepID=UPI001CFA0920|nr:protein Mis18-beta isoform X2 [Protopterus annectens]